MSKNFNYNMVSNSKQWEELDTYDDCIECNSYNVECEVFVHKNEDRFKAFIHCMDCGKIVELKQVLRI